MNSLMEIINLRNCEWHCSGDHQHSVFLMEMYNDLKASDTNTALGNQGNP